MIRHPTRPTRTDTLFPYPTLCRSDHGRAALTLADIAARLQCLTEGQPALARPPRLDHRAPQDQDIDPRISTARTRIVRQGRRCATAAAPRLHPRQPPLLQFGYNPVRHAVVQRRAGFPAARRATVRPVTARSEEHTSELQSLMRTSYADCCV